MSDYALIVTDQHFGVNRNNKIDYKYMIKYYHERVFPLINHYGIKHVIDIGDTLDKSAKLNNEFIDLFSKDYLSFFERNGINLHVISGNHKSNVFNNGTFGKLNSVTCYTEPRPLEINHNQYFAMPWSCDRELPSYELNNHIVFAHCSVKSTLVNPERKAKEGISSEFFRNAQKVYCGHIHSRSTHKNITNLGSSHFLKWQDALNNEKRGAYIIELLSGKIREINNEFMRYQVIKDINIPFRKPLPGSMIKIYLSPRVSNAAKKYIVKSFEKYCLEKLIVIGSWDEYVNEAQTLLKSGYYKSCIQLCDKISQFWESSFQADAIKAASYLRLGEYENGYKAISKWSNHNSLADQLISDCRLGMANNFRMTS